MDSSTPLLVAAYLSMGWYGSRISSELAELVYTFFADAQSSSYAVKNRRVISGIATKIQASIVVATGLALALPSVAVASPSIEAVVLRPGYGMGYGGAVTVAYRARVLYADGGYTADAGGALGPSPRIDGRWQREGGGYVLQPAKDGAKPEHIKPSMKAKPARRGTTLEGEYRNLSGAGATGMDAPLVAAARSLRFAKDGTLISTASASAATGDTVATGHSGAAARYTLDGWTITTTDTDGRSDTRLFYFFPDSNDVIGVGGSTLSRRR